MTKICIKGGRVVLPTGIEEINIISENGKITNLTKATPEDCKVIEASGMLVTPGFVETHVHGGGGADFSDADVKSFETAVKTHLKHGVTYIYPTTMSCSKKQLFDIFTTYREVKSTPLGKLMGGLHLEGPFLNPDMCGAQRADIIRTPKKEETDELFENADIIARMTCAPEIDGMEYLAKKASEKNILLSVGHSGATAEEARRALDMGFSHITHLYSATTTVRKINQRIYAGINEAAYLYDDYRIELIGDGRHVAKETMQMAVKIKGADKINLTGDSMRAAGQDDVTESYLGDICPENRVIIEDGVAKLPDRSFYAGSIATMDRMFKNAVFNYDISIEDAVTMLSKTPASLMGANNKGTIETGKDCDILIWNDDFTLNKIIVGGSEYETQI